jgi:hypothetical protein
VVAKQSENRLKKFLRLKNQKKPANHVLEKEYEDEDLEEFNESMLESYVN